MTAITEKITQPLDLLNAFDDPEGKFHLRTLISPSV